MELILKLILVLDISVCAYAGEGQMMDTIESSGNMAGGTSRLMYPWVARIEIDGVLKCHGSLINERFVLTAKNCVRKGSDYRNVSVLLGRFDLNTPTTMDNITAVLQNISVETCHEIEGVVLLELTVLANVSYPFVGVIPLATAYQVSKITKKHKCFVSGFGAIKPGKVATKLQTVKLQIEANRKCNNKIKSGFDSTKDLCFRVKKSGGPCMQDIGTAVVCHKNAGNKNPGDVFQVAVEMMKSDKSPTKKKCYGGSYLASLQTGPIRGKLLVAMGEPNWNGFKVTWGLNPLTSFRDLPRTKADAVHHGWVAMAPEDTCDSNPHFRGERMWKDSDAAVIIIFDPAGYIAGIQAGVPKNYHTNPNNYPFASLINSPFVLVGNTYYITAYFVSPAHLCNGRTAAKFHSEGTGEGLWIQNGTDPHTHLARIPMTQTEADASLWTKGACFPSMGLHYWYQLSKDMDCTNFYPVFLLYNEGVLNAFGWAFMMNLQESSRYEHPSQSSYGLFMSPPPDCLSTMGTFTTMHIYLTDRATADLC